MTRAGRYPVDSGLRSYDQDTQEAAAQPDPVLVKEVMVITKRPEVLNGFTAKTESPEGTVFTTINEDKQGRVVEIRIIIGKGGSTLAAWADALARVTTLALQAGADISTLLAEISGITSARIKKQNGVLIRCGPEAVSYAIMTYLRERHKQDMKGLDPDDDMASGRIDPE